MRDGHVEIGVMVFKHMCVCVSWLTGDFAVLLKAGMSVKQAIVYNLLSALMAYVGMLIGTVVGQYTHNVTNWIFAITAGMFLYVALVDMVSWHGAFDSPRVIITPLPLPSFPPFKHQLNFHFLLCLLICNANPGEVCLSSPTGCSVSLS